MESNLEHNKRVAAIAVIAIVFVMMFLVAALVYTIFDIQSTSRQPKTKKYIQLANQLLRKTEVSLEKGLETDNFGVLAQGGVTVLNYNRLAGQTLLVCFSAFGLNAGSASNKAPEAVEHAHQLTQALQETNNSIAGRLSEKLRAEVQKLGGAVAYLEQPQTQDAQSATNIVIEKQMQPFIPSNNTATLLNDPTRVFFKGYNVSDIGGLALPLGVPLRYGRPVKRVQKDFNRFSMSPEQWKDWVIPPNTFSFIPKDKGGEPVYFELGSYRTTYPLAISYGYIEIVVTPRETQNLQPNQGAVSLTQLIEHSGGTPFFDTVVFDAQGLGVQSRILLMSPVTSAMQVRTLFANTRLTEDELRKGSKLFIYQTAQGSSEEHLTISATAPPSYKREELPDGPILKRFSGQSCLWQPSSGFNNFLGRLTLQKSSPPES